MRGKAAKIRKIEKDVLYESTKITKLINYVMLDGKKELAEKIVYDTLRRLKKELKKDPLEVFEKALSNVSPSVEIRPRRVGGVNYQIPINVSEERKLTLALRWLIEGARDRRKNTPFSQSLFDELRDAYKGTGSAMKKKGDVEKMAEANKAFAHFQW